MYVPFNITHISYILSFILISSTCFFFKCIYSNIRFNMKIIFDSLRVYIIKHKIISRNVYFNTFHTKLIFRRNEIIFFFILEQKKLFIIFSYWMNGTVLKIVFLFFMCSFIFFFFNIFIIFIKRQEYEGILLGGYIKSSWFYKC